MKKQNSTGPISITPEQEKARKILVAILSGNEFPDIQPDECGKYANLLTDLLATHQNNGVEAAKKQLETAIRADDQLALLMNMGIGKAAEPLSAPPDLPKRGCPPLPAEPQAIYTHAAPCGQWLDEWLKYAKAASPMSPELLHELTGLSALSIAVARRVCWQEGAKEIYPNIYGLYIGFSSVQRKSTALELMKKMLYKAGLDHLQIGAKPTPEALAAQMDYEQEPSDIIKRSKQKMERWLRERAFAAQRAWIVDEVSGLFGSFSRDYQKGLLELMLKLHGCPDYDKLDESIGRGTTAVEKVYITMLGIGTPKAMQPHFADENLWGTGLFARFCIVTSDEVPEYIHYPREIIADDVAHRLAEIYRMFPMPEAMYQSEKDQEGNATTPKLQVQRVQAEPVELADGVYEAWERYARAVGHTMLQGDTVECALHPSYARLGDMALKVAMLLAVADTKPHKGGGPVEVVVGLRHFARAQRIVERWRESLHRIWSTQTKHVDEQKLEKILDELAKRGLMLTGDIQRYAHTGPAEYTRKLLKELEQRGDVVTMELKATNGKMAEYWSLAENNH